MTFVWQWPQITMLSIWAFALVCYAIIDGKPREASTWRFSHRLLNTILYGGLLFFGGFFTEARP